MAGIYNIAMMISVLCLSSTSFSYFELVNVSTLVVVPIYIGTNVILIPIYDHLFSLLGLWFSRRSVRQPILPFHRLDLRPEDIPVFQSMTALPTLRLLRAELEMPGCDF